MSFAFDVEIVTLTEVEPSPALAAAGREAFGSNGDELLAPFRLMLRAADSTLVEKLIVTVSFVSTPGETAQNRIVVSAPKTGYDLLCQERPALSAIVAVTEFEGQTTKTSIRSLVFVVVMLIVLVIEVLTKYDAACPSIVMAIRTFHHPKLAGRSIDIPLPFYPN